MGGSKGTGNQLKGIIQTSRHWFDVNKRVTPSEVQAITPASNNPKVAAVRQLRQRG